MLLRFTSPDMLNSSLIDVATSERAFDISTELLAELPKTPSLASSKPFSGTSSAVLSLSEPSPSTSSVHWAQQREPLPDSQSSITKECPDLRRTRITDPSGKSLVDVIWQGRRPDITICGEKIGGLSELFGSSTVRFMPKILAIPTRFDTEYVWLATANSLSLFDYDTDSVQGSFHQNCIRIPAPLKSSKFKASIASTGLKHKPSFAAKLSLFSSSKPNVSSALDEDESPKSPSSYTPKSTFIPTYLPGVGSNYLEFSPHPLAQDVEIILSFLMMEILRRGRFSLTPYTFDNPTMWQFKEARESFLRRLRRNTV